MNKVLFWALLLLIGSSSELLAHGQLNAYPGALAFSDTPVNNVNELTVQFVNTSSQSFDITDMETSAPFVLVSGNYRYTLAPNGSVTILLAFNPTAAGNSSGGLHVVTNTGYHITVPLSGYGYTAPIQIDTSSMPFGNKAIGTVSSWTATLSNMGSVPFHIMGVSVTGTGFSVTPISTPMTVNGTAPVQVVFNPMDPVSCGGALTITTDGEPNTFTVPLSGAGIPGSHWVGLSLAAPTSSPAAIAGYNVYRSTSASGPFSLIGSVSLGSVPPDNPLTPGTTFTDDAVAAGATYYYQVTSATASGVESAPSQVISASVPTP